MQQIIIKTRTRNYRWLALLGLTLLLALAGQRVALADSETIADPPRVQNAGGYTITFVSPGDVGPMVNQDVSFKFRVTDVAGKPADGLELNMTAIRNYSGQVKKEHNGPRTPNLGPIVLLPTGQPGEYQASLNFDYNGHWNIKIGGNSLKETSVLFRQPIAAEANSEAGIGWDWLLWVGIMLVVAAIVAIIRTSGEKFPVPMAELSPIKDGK